MLTLQWICRTLGNMFSTKKLNHGCPSQPLLVRAYHVRQTLTTTEWIRLG